MGRIHPDPHWRMEASFLPCEFSLAVMPTLAYSVLSVSCLGMTGYVNEAIDWTSQ